MRPTIELELIDDPSIFPLCGNKGVPDRGLTTWFKTQPDWYENANYKGYAIRMIEGQPVVCDPEEPDDEPLPISGLVQHIWEDLQGPGWNDPQYTITHKSETPTRLPSRLHFETHEDLIRYLDLIGRENITLYFDDAVDGYDPVDIRLHTMDHSKYVFTIDSIEYRKWCDSEIAMHSMPNAWVCSTEDLLQQII